MPTLVGFLCDLAFFISFLSMKFYCLFKKEKEINSYFRKFRNYQKDKKKKIKVYFLSYIHKSIHIGDAKMLF